nr:DUF58 domain-containing protein [Agromyces seonyuensis]
MTRTAGSTGTSTRSRVGTVTRTSRSSGDTVGATVYRARVAGRALRTAWSASIGWVRETVTTAGLVLLAVAVVGIAGGISFGWVEAWVFAGIAILLVLVCLPFLAGTHDYGIDLALGADRVVAGSQVDGRLVLVNRGKRASLPGVVDIPVGEGLVEVHVPLLRAGAHHEEQLAINAARRGVIDIGPMTIGRGDPLGILRRELSWPEVRRVYVHPVTTAIPSTSAGLIRDLEGSATTTLSNSDLNFHAVREYVPGDSRKHVHWKATAKTGRLMVRQYEESRHARIAVLVDLEPVEFGSDDEFELAVSAAASLGVQGVREGRDVLVASSGELPELARGAVQTIRTFPTHTPGTLLDGLSEIVPGRRVMRLESVAQLTAATFTDLSIAFMVTGSNVPLQRLRQAAVAFPANLTAVVVRAEPGAEPSVRTARELTVITIGTLGDLAHLLARGAIK